MDQFSWVMPLLLMPGVGLLITSTSARFSQVHEELRYATWEPLHHIVYNDKGHSELIKFLRMTVTLEELQNQIVLFSGVRDDKVKNPPNSQYQKGS
jgi:hypothetical protein